MNRKMGPKTATEGDKKAERLADYEGKNYTTLPSKVISTDPDQTSDDLPQSLQNLANISDDQQTNVSTTTVVSDTTTSTVKPEAKVCSF